MPYTLKLSPYRADYKLPANAIGVRPFVPYGHAVSLSSSDLSSFSFIFFIFVEIALGKSDDPRVVFFPPKFKWKIGYFLPTINDV